MAVSALDLDSKISKAATNMDRLNGIVNGDASTDITVDAGLVPSYAKLASLVTGLVPLFNRATQTKSADYSVVNGDNGKTLILTGSAKRKLTFATASGYDTIWSATIVNTSSRGWLCELNDSLGVRNYIIWPGTVCTINSVGVGVWLPSFGKSGPKLLGTEVSGGGRVTMNVNPSTGNNTLNDGLGTDSPLATVGRARDILVYDADLHGAAARVLIADGSVVRENIVHSYQVRGNNLVEIMGNVTWAYDPAGGYGIMVRDGAILQIRARDPSTGTFRFVPTKLVSGVETAQNNGISLASTHMSVMDVGPGVEMANHPGGAAKMFLCEESHMGIGDYDGYGSCPITLTGGSGGNVIEASHGAMTVGVEWKIPASIAVGGDFLAARYNSRISCGANSFTGSGVAGSTGRRGYASTGSHIINKSYFDAGLTSMTAFGNDSLSSVV